MSTYYDFYLGYKAKGDDKLHAFGPYDKFGNLTSFLCKSRSFISDIHEEFRKCSIEQLDDELKDKFTYTYSDPGKNEKVYCNLYYLDYDELPSNCDYMKSGFYPVDEVTEYIQDKESLDFYYTEYYSPTEYGMKLATAVNSNDEEQIKWLKSFVFFTYPDYNSIEYDTYYIKKFIWNCMDDYYIENRLKDHGQELDKIVILLRIG